MKRSPVKWSLPLLAILLLQLGSFRRSLRLSLTATFENDANDMTTTPTAATTTQSPPLASTESPLTTLSPHQDRLESMERLKDALHINTTMELLQKLSISKDDIPLWSTIDKLYGPNFPHIMGMERCPAYQAATPVLKDRWVAPAGMFHTGTNLMAKVIAETCQGVVKRWQVPYGKHHPINAVLEDNFIMDKPQYKKVGNFSKILPIVMVRNPLDWMVSECKQKFGIRFSQNNETTRPLPCPHLTTELDVNFYRPHHYQSMLHLWMEWYQQYLQYDGPRLLVRLEDMIYFPEQTLEKICDCAGGTFNYSHTALEERKGGTQRNETGNYRFKAWKRHAEVSIDNTFGRSWANKKRFWQVAETAEMQNLLKAFHYTLPESNTNNITAIE